MYNSMNDSGLIREFFLKHGVLAGSRAYGTHQEHSDYDIIIDVQNIRKVRQVLDTLDITESEYFRGLYFIDKDGAKVNLIFLNPVSYNAWVQAIPMMREFMKMNPRVRGAMKYGVFEQLVGICKTVQDVIPIKDHIL